MSTLRELLNDNFDDITQPTPIPEGEWVFKIGAVSTFTPKKDKSGGILLKLVPEEKGEDVDPEEFDAYTAEEPLSEKAEWHRLPLGGRQDQHRARKFFESIGVDGSGKTLLQTAESAEGVRLFANVEHQQSQDEDDDRIFVRLRGFAAVEGGAD